MNPEGQVPLVDLGDGRYLRQSNAILLYLAHGSSLVLADLWTNEGGFSLEPPGALETGLQVSGNN